MRIIILTGICLFGEGLEAWLRKCDHVQVTGVTQDVGALRLLMATERTDLALVDVTSGTEPERFRALAAEQPEVTFVALGLTEQPEEVIRCARAGFAAYVARDATLDRLEFILLDAIAGRASCRPDIFASLMRAMFRGELEHLPEARGQGLTHRENQVLHLVGRGLSNKEIAFELTMSAATVKNHVHNLLGKLGLPRRSEIMCRMRQRIWTAGPALRHVHDGEITGQ